MPTYAVTSEHLHRLVYSALVTAENEDAAREIFENDLGPEEKEMEDYGCEYRDSDTQVEEVLTPD